MQGKIKIRPELSKRSKYHISKYRQLELKNFCLQYPEWNVAISAANYYPSPRINEVMLKRGESPVEAMAEKLESYKRKVELINRIAKETDYELWQYILVGVTQDKSYEYLQTNRGIPCSRGTYYDRYRKFFYLLDSEKD